MVVRRLSTGKELPVPEIKNPAEIRISLTFGLLYMTVLFLTMDFSNLFKHETETVNFAVGETNLRLGETAIFTAHAGALLGELSFIVANPAAQTWLP